MKKDLILRLLAPFFIAVIVLFGSLAYLADSPLQAAEYVSQPTVDHTLMVGGNRATMTITSTTRSGVTQTLAAGDTDGHKFSNDGKVFIIATATFPTRTLTFITPGTIDGLDIEDLVVTIVPTSTKLIGPFPPQHFNQITGSDKGYVYIDIDGDTGLTLGAFKVGN